ncbi:phage antirepressor KilAC domain-containing protein [[Clostridium] colinum]|uniref:phage antirepressor KilAC domain-containing protein n=1 Tax=[Clostridium] colinum TaxID=36835 RepID=UPI002025373D|nr:phage antirepressor [[Clostridium] colinum]
MNNIELFKNESFGEVRTLLINDEVWFVGKDVAEALGYKNTRDALSKHIDIEDKTDVAIYDGSQNRNMTIINESGLYSLILSSKLPQAKEFKRWVTNEVLPSIRKHGGYLTPQKIEEVLLNPDTIIKLATDLKEEKEKNATLTLVNKQQEQVINELKPKATYYDLILQCPDLLSVTQIAKDYGMSGTRLNKKLNELGIQYKHRETWLLYSKYQDKGYTSSTTHDYVDSKGTIRSRLQTYWTQKGRLFIYEQLKRVNILPLIEKENIKDAI